MRHGTCFLCGVLLLAPQLGCRRETPVSPTEAARLAVEEHAKLTLTRRSADTSLHEELARIEGQAGLPRQLTSRRIEPEFGTKGWQRPEGELLPDEKNAAVGILAALPAEKHKFVRNSLEDLYPEGPLQFDGVTIRQVRDVLHDYREQRQAYQQAIQRPHCDFAFQFQQGLLADTAALDAALLGNRLLVLAGADALYDGNALGASRILPDVFRVAAWVGQQRTVTASAAADRLRYEALRLVEAVVQHPATTPEIVQQCHDLLAKELANLPADHQAWIGERAIGLHTYEMVRAGEILSLLNEEELKVAVEQGVDAFTAAIFEGIDNDELFYLASMRQTISGCDLPYHLRVRVLERIELQLDERLSTQQYPFVAAMLLKNSRLGHLAQSRDRAGLQAWTLLLAAATGRDISSASPNPLTGEPFEVQISGTRVELYGLSLPREDERWQEPLVAPRVAADNE